jgi:hypothetical protein
MRYHRKDQRVDLMRSGTMRGTGAESRPESAKFKEKYFRICSYRILSE